MRQVTDLDRQPPCGYCGDPVGQIAWEHDGSYYCDVCADGIEVDS